VLATNQASLSSFPVPARDRGDVPPLGRIFLLPPFEAWRSSLGSKNTNEVLPAVFSEWDVSGCAAWVGDFAARRLGLSFPMVLKSDFVETRVGLFKSLLLKICLTPLSAPVKTPRKSAVKPFPFFFFFSALLFLCCVAVLRGFCRLRFEGSFGVDPPGISPFHCLFPPPRIEDYVTFFPALPSRANEHLPPLCDALTPPPL